MPDTLVFDKKYFFDKWRELFGMRRGNLRYLSQPQVDCINLIIHEFDRASMRESKSQLAYILATAYHETAHTMLPVRETLATSDEQARRRLRNRWYAQVDKVTGRSYYGRGFVQLTHKSNYKRAGEKIGVPELVIRPDLALNPEIAARILVRGMLEGWFTGRPLGRYVNATDKDYFRARQVVNGLDVAAKIGTYAEQIDHHIVLA